MNLVKYDPFRELRSIQDEMTRLFTGLAPSEFERGATRYGAWNPSVDIYEEKDNLVLEAELPGMKRDDFDLTIENNVVTLKGDRKFEKKTEGDNYHRVERAYGSFTRSFTLPPNVSGDGAKAEFDDGLLRVTFPKREEAKAKKIEIGGRSASQPKTIEAETKSDTKTANA